MPHTVAHEPHGGMPGKGFRLAWRRRSCYLRVHCKGNAAVNLVRTFMLLTFVASSLAFSAGSAAANCKRWIPAFVGGTAGSGICDNRGSSITVSCRLTSMREYEDNVGEVAEDGTYYRLGINFWIEGAPAPGNKLTLKFDDILPIEVEIRDGDISNYHNLCPSCMKNYNNIVSLLRIHNRVSVQTEDGRTKIFTLRGAAKAIPNCTYGFKGEVP